MVEVVAALIWSGDNFLICKRPPEKARGLMWEFVGGKVENDESKGSFVVKSLAVNKAIATRACAGDNDVALLLYCPPAFIKSGDKACF